MSCHIEHVGKARYNAVTDWKSLGYYKDRLCAAVIKIIAQQLQIKTIEKKLAGVKATM